MKGKPITQRDRDAMFVLRENGKTNKEIAEIMNLSPEAVANHIGTDRPKPIILNEPTDNKDIKALIEKIPDEVVSRINGILDITPDIKDYVLTLESIGFSKNAKEQRRYEKKIGKNIIKVTYFNRDQITYLVCDEYGKEMERYYFNSELIEALFGGVVHRGWNYFR